MIQVGAHQLSVGLGPDGDPVASKEVVLVRARRKVAYRVAAFGECGNPVHAMLDGRSWVADDPERLLDPGATDLLRLPGELTLSSSTRGTFVADDGRTSRVTAAAGHFFC